MYLNLYFQCNGRRNNGESQPVTTEMSPYGQKYEAREPEAEFANYPTLDAQDKYPYGVYLTGTQREDKDANIPKFQ